MANGCTSTPTDGHRYPRVLVSNDDGIHAPGLRALVAALVAADFCSVFVAAPSSERSASSHCITLTRYLSCAHEPIEGVEASFAVDGTPADSVMLALNSDLFTPRQRDFDLVVSGINRGDNCGLHVIYSGTVAAAREAAAVGLPALAFSLDHHQAKAVEDYRAAAALCIPIIKAALGSLLPGTAGLRQALRQCVVNVNFPSHLLPRVEGLHYCHQGSACLTLEFREIREEAGPHAVEIEAHTADIRMFRNYTGGHRNDDTPGSDTWAVKAGWVAVTPIGLRSDVCRLDCAVNKEQALGHVEATKALVREAALAAGLPAGGV